MDALRLILSILIPPLEAVSADGDVRDGSGPRRGRRGVTSTGGARAATRPPTGAGPGPNVGGEEG